MIDEKTPVLRVKDASKYFGKGCPQCPTATGAEHGLNQCPHCGTVVACRSVSLELYPNEVLGIVGESGSGKSTLIRLIGFDWTASTGHVSMEFDPETSNGLSSYSGKNLLELAPHIKRKIRNACMGVVYQHPHLGLRMNVTAGGNVAERLLMAGWRKVQKMRARANDLLEKTEVPTARMDEPPSNFSGGMQQRVQIAKALSNSPMLLLLDEMTTGLDVSVQARVIDLVRKLQKELRVAMIVVSHDLGVIRMLTSRTMVMKNGEIVETGLTDQVLEDPQHPYTQLLVSSAL